MTGYIGIPIETDPATLSADALDTLMESIPGFVPQEGNLEVWLIEVWAQMNAETRDVASSVPTTIFRYFGQSLLGIPPVEAASATTTVTITAVDNLGYTIPADTTLAFRTAGDELVPFRVVNETVISPGSTTVAGVLIEALDPGEAGDGLGPGPVELVDALSYVADITAEAVTAGGVDAESDEAYLDRLAAELQLLAPRPILPHDFAVLARRVAGVQRAIAIDGYDPATGTYNNERMVTVALVDADGNAVPQAVRDEAASLLDSSREVNFIVNIADPSYTAVTVTFECTALAEYTLDDVKTRSEEAVSTYLSPATWGGGDESPPEWNANSSTIRYLELAQVINNVAGVDYIISLMVNGNAADLLLDGIAPLPTVESVTGTVTYG